MKFSPNLVEKYISVFNKYDINKLRSLNVLVNILKKDEPKFLFKKNIDEIIHQNGIFYSQHRKFTNIEILKCLKIN